ncbi:MAG TPA: clostripain-related cysteine peptidase [Puia sp.]|jgi:hypothetical protein
MAPRKNQTDCGWLIVIFIHEVAFYRKNWNKIVDDIAKKGPGPEGSNNQIYLIRDSVREMEDPANPGSRINSFRLSVNQLKKKPDGSYKFLKEKVDFDNRDRNCWKAGFRYVYDKLKGRRNMLISISHGAAFGIDVDTTKVVRPNIPVEMRMALANTVADNKPKKMVVVSNDFYYLDKKEISEMRKRKNWASTDPKTKKFITEGRIPKKGKDNFCRNLEILWIADLAATLRDLLGKTKIDLTLLNNCYMQAFDTGYLLRDNASYIVAAEGALRDEGYDYLALLDRIYKDANVDNKTLASGVIKDYKAFYEREQMSDDLDGQAIFANNTAPYEDALTLFNEVLDGLRKNWAAAIPQLVEIREKYIMYVSTPQRAYPLDKMNMIDAFQWALLVADRVGCFAGTDLRKRIEAMHKAIVADSSVGSLLTGHDAVTTSKFGYMGISLFYPNTEDWQSLNYLPWCAYFGDQNPSVWKDNWQQFLVDYYRASANLGAPHLPAPPPGPLPPAPIPAPPGMPVTPTPPPGITPPVRPVPGPLPIGVPSVPIPPNV